MRIRFDRGTLVLEPEHEGEDPSQIHGSRWDEVTRAWRMRADHYRELIVRPPATGVRFSDMTRIARLGGTWNLPPLRDYQQAALAGWHAAGRRGVVALPTGAGKTLVALAAIAALDVSTLILVPTRLLLDQWARTLERCGAHAVGRLGDGDRHVAPITVATFASATAWASSIGDRFGLVVVDEAHHVGSTCPADLFEMFVAPATLGLTATPPRGALAAELARRLGPTVASVSIDELAGTALATYEVRTIPIALGLDERRRYDELRARFAATYADVARSAHTDSWPAFVRIAMRSPAGREALDAWRAYRALLALPTGKRAVLRELLAAHADTRTLVFTSDTASVYAIARELLIPPLTHEIGRVERADILDRFRRGELTAIVAAQVLDEGFDVPEADIAIVVGGSGSARRHVQRMGRVLRPRPGKRALVYELVVDDSVELRQLDGRRGHLPARNTMHRPTSPRAVGGAR